MLISMYSVIVLDYSLSGKYERIPQTHAASSKNDNPLRNFMTVQGALTPTIKPEPTILNFPNPMGTASMALSSKVTEIRKHAPSDNTSLANMPPSYYRPMPRGLHQSSPCHYLKPPVGSSLLERIVYQ
ncbi:hypothetical protein PT974_02202 [Cladobotryum mycophilum]|uniref:Uncharacterized protein n=1 Tax=Cladobotryum mycophilum TaxID=491253 RepID=A0ABR0SY94_9HYPO